MAVVYMPIFVETRPSYIILMSSICEAKLETSVVSEYHVIFGSRRAGIHVLLDTAMLICVVWRRGQYHA